MRIAGNYTFDATREEVWAAINDPEVLARTIPGCQRLDEVGENEYETTLKIGLQAVRGIYTGRVKIDNVVAPESYDLHVDGKGSNGFLKGNGGIKLRSEGEQTILDYGGEAQIGGTIASVGQRLIDGASKTLINQSLKALAAQIEARRNPPPAAEPELAEAPTNPAAPAAPLTPITPANVDEMTPLDPAHTPAAPPPDPAAPTGAEPELAEAPTNPAAPAAPRSPITPTNVAAVTPMGAASAAERRSIVVPPHEQLRETDVARGVIEDFIKENPWAPWVLLAFMLGYLLGRRK